MILRIVQIDEINIFVVASGSRDGPNRQCTSLTAKTGEDFLLLCDIANDVRTFVRWMINFLTSKAPAIQFRHKEVFSGLERRVIIEQFRERFDGANSAITRKSTCIPRALHAPATIRATIGTTEAITSIATSGPSCESSHCIGPAGSCSRTWM